MTYEEFLIKCKEIHGDRYDYSNSIYITHGTKLLIKCNLCYTEWMVRPSHHIGKSKSGCPTCANESRRKIKSKNGNTFILEAMKIHNGKYNYDLCEYVKNNSKVKITCPEHGIFEQTPSVHLKGFGCKFCTGYKSTEKQENEYNLYKSKVWSFSNKSYRRYKDIINPNSLIRSRTIHLDHKYSILDGFKNRIDPEIIGHYRNLQILSSVDNRKKWDKSSITLKELHYLINEIP